NDLDKCYNHVTTVEISFADNNDRSKSQTLKNRMLCTLTSDPSPLSSTHFRTMSKVTCEDDSPRALVIVEESQGQTSRSTETMTEGTERETDNAMDYDSDTDLIFNHSVKVKVEITEG